MAFDGITISSIVNELNDTINGGRLYKISQPEADEIMLTIKTQSAPFRRFRTAANLNEMQMYTLFESKNLFDKIV